MRRRGERIRRGATRLAPPSLLACGVAFLTAAAAGEGPASPADLSRLVIVGDSLSAGYQNGSLLASQQEGGWAALLARQAGVELPLPLVAEPGIPPVLVLESAGPPPVIQQAPGSSPGRLDLSLQPFNLAVPGATAAGALNDLPALTGDGFIDLILGWPGLFHLEALSQADRAAALAPTTVVVWLGTSEVLGAAAAADPATIPPVEEFEAPYTLLLDRVTSGGAALVVANVPDFAVFPYFTPAAEIAAYLKWPMEKMTKQFGLRSGDWVTPAAAARVAAILAGTESGPLPASVVLTAAEAKSVRQAARRYNEIIAAEAKGRGGCLVDVAGLLSALDAEGIEVGSQRLTTRFLGGVFSLDGLHPTDTGQALLANRFIARMNRKLGTAIPKIRLRDVAATDPLVPPFPASPAVGE